MPFPLPSLKDRHFFPAISTVSWEGEGKGGDFELLSTKSHEIYPRDTLENTQTAYIQPRLTEMLI